MARPRWRAIRIDAKRWKLVEQAPVKFIRSDHMLPLPDPVRLSTSEIGIGTQLAAEIGEIIPTETYTM